MRILKTIFDFFVFTSLFIAVCAVLMTLQTGWLFRVEVTASLIGFIFCGTVCSYNFHWYLTPPVVDEKATKLLWNAANRPIHLGLALGGGIGAAYFGLQLIEGWYWLGLTSVFTFLYSAPMIPHPFFYQLRRFAIAKTIYLALAWTMVTVMLPLVFARDIGSYQALFFLNRFFFIYAICILFDYRDVEEDRKAGIRSLITYLTPKGVHRLFWGSMIVYLLTTLALVPAFGLPAVIALLLPGLILAGLYRKALTQPGDYLYYFVLDGLMMLSAPLVLFVTFDR